MRVLPIASMLVVVMSGCATSSLGPALKALGQDTNSVSITVTSPWGTVDVRRNLPAK